MIRYRSVMKIAYLILAHTDPLQLRRLITALGREHAVFVHINKKASVSALPMRCSADTTSSSSMTGSR